MTGIQAKDDNPRREATVLGSTMSYVDTGGDGPTVVFLHGNPTSNYLWRNVIPPVAATGARCLAPDLIGMGRSAVLPDGTQYTFAEHAKYLDGWFDAVLPDGPLVLVLHDWGGALGFHWARRHADRVAGIAYMETIVCPIGWDDWPEAARGIFQGFRSDAGEKLILEKNLFIEAVLPNSILRDLTPEEHDVYRAPFREAGERRRPTLTWPRHIPIEGEPAEMVALVREYGAWLEQSDIPKLFINAEPGSILVGRQRDYCRSWPNQTETTVRGSHFIQEDSPAEIGAAVADFIASLR